MKERPIIFSAPMVKAILAGAKTQTRRVVKAQTAFEVIDGEICAWTGFMGWQAAEAALHPDNAGLNTNPEIRCPYGQPGDQLWVRETVITHVSIPQVHGYAADGCAVTERWQKVRNSRFMPRWASRITLEVTDVRVQQVQTISNEDAFAEGCDFRIAKTPNHVGAFATLWDKINLKRGFGWYNDPWVWAVTFRRVKP
jgi:hypothetical protein